MDLLIVFCVTVRFGRVEIPDDQHNAPLMKENMAACRASAAALPAHHH